MPPLVKINMKLNSAAVSASLRELSNKSTRLPSYLVNKAVLSTAIRAQKAMPVVKPGKMDSELNAAKATELVRIKSGKRWSRDRKHQKFFFGPVGNGAHPDVPLAALIINAQVNPGSNFNRLTGGVFLRAESPFKGKSRAAGAQAMLDAMRRLLGARHSSSGFFRLCAAVVASIYRQATSTVPGVADKVQTGFEALPGSGNVTSKIGRLAGGTVAHGTGNLQARASFWVTATEPDTKGESKNAIFSIAQPVWQRAVDDEAVSISNHARSIYTNAARSVGIPVGP